MLPRKAFLNQDPLVIRKGNYEVNFCISFCLLSLFLPKNNPKTFFRIDDPLSSPEHKIFSPGHTHK